MKKIMTKVPRTKGTGWRFLAIYLAINLSLLYAVPFSFANPELDQITHGSGSVSIDGDVYNFNQASEQLIADFHTFNIAGHETTNVNQPSVDAAALFHIHDQNPSQIFGGLNATGNLFLENANGIVFGEGAQVNVGGLIASTLELADAEFLKGNYELTSAQNGSGQILNKGNITAREGGYVALVGSSVRNAGTIQADGGSVALVVAEKATVSLDGDGLVSVAVHEKLENKVYDSSGTKIKDGILNTGVLGAQDGRVILSAAARAEVFDNVINHEGMINATSVVERNGEIFLVGGDEGIVSVSGELDARGAEGLEGGTIHVLGDKVGIFDGAEIDASGDSGGGEVLIGGDFQGKNPEIQNARRTHVDENTVIRADAITNGDGGKVIVWADEVTAFNGLITARGGSESGNGGFAEVSAPGLNYQGFTDLRAANGEIGTLLLDPKNATVSDNGASGVVANDTFAENAAADADFSDENIEAALNGANLTLQVNNDFTISQAIDASGNGGVGNLEIQAGRDVNVNADVTLRGSFTATANIATAQAANRDAGDANFTMGSTNTINTSNQNGTISITYGNGANGNDATGAATIGILNSGTGAVTVNTTANDGGGASTENITFNGAVTAGGMTVTGNAVNVNAAITNTGASNTVFNAGGTFTTAAAGDINTGTGVFQVLGGNAASIAGDVTTNGALLQFSGATTLTGAVALSTGAGGGGNPEFLSTLNGAQTLTVTAGSGNTVFNGIGGTTPLTALTVTATTGAITFNTADVSVAGNIDLTGGNVNVNRNVTTTNGGFFESTNSGTLAMVAASNFNLDGAFLQNGSGNSNLQNDITTTGDNISFATAVNMFDTSTLNTGAGAGNVTITGALNNGQTLNITAGTGAVTFGNTVGNASALTAISIASAANVEFDNTVSVGTLTQTTGSGTTNFDNTVTATGAVNVANDAITFSTAGNISAAGQSVTLNAETGSITGGTAATDVTAGSVNFDAVTGIGSSGNTFNVVSPTLNIDNSGTGDVHITQAATAGVTANSLTTGTGNLTYAQTGNQTLLVTTASATGTVTITNTGAAADITVGSVTANSSNTVTINSGRDILESGADAGADVTGGTVNLTAGNDIGTGGNPLEVQATVNNNTVGGTANVTLSSSSTTTGTFTAPVNATVAGDATATNLSVTGSGNSVQVTSTGGDVSLSNVSAQDTVVITAASDINGSGSSSTPDIIASGEAVLDAGNTIGSTSTAVSVQVSGDGTLKVTAGGETNGLSANLTGNLDPSSVVVSDGSPGLVVYNGVIIGGNTLDEVESDLSTSSGANDQMLDQMAAPANSAFVSQGFVSQNLLTTQMPQIDDSSL